MVLVPVLGKDCRWGVNRLDINRNVGWLDFSVPREGNPDLGVVRVLAHKLGFGNCNRGLGGRLGDHGIGYKDKNGYSQD